VARFASELLAKQDHWAFSSGNLRIDNYFKQTVSQDIKRN
jgi:hypothetical protein